MTDEHLKRDVAWSMDSDGTISNAYGAPLGEIPFSAVWDVKADTMTCTTELLGHVTDMPCPCIPLGEYSAEQAETIATLEAIEHHVERASDAAFLSGFSLCFTLMCVAFTAFAFWKGRREMS